MTDIAIKGKTFYDKISRLIQDSWGTNAAQNADFTAFLFNLGVVKDESSQPKTSQFHLWLMSYEFSETVIIVTQ